MLAFCIAMSESARTRDPARMVSISRKAVGSEGRHSPLGRHQGGQSRGCAVPHRNSPLPLRKLAAIGASGSMAGRVRSRNRGDAGSDARLYGGSSYAPLDNLEPLR
jgi:hypothetical protein